MEIGHFICVLYCVTKIQKFVPWTFFRLVDTYFNYAANNLYKYLNNATALVGTFYACSILVAFGSISVYALKNTQHLLQQYCLYANVLRKQNQNAFFCIFLHLLNATKKMPKIMSLNHPLKNHVGSILRPSRSSALGLTC